MRGRARERYRLVARAHGVQHEIRCGCFGFRVCTVQRGDVERVRLTHQTVVGQRDVRVDGRCVHEATYAAFLHGADDVLRSFKVHLPNGVVVADVDVDDAGKVEHNVRARERRGK